MKLTFRKGNSRSNTRLSGFSAFRRCLGSLRSDVVWVINILAFSVFSASLSSILSSWRRVVEKSLEELDLVFVGPKPLESPGRVGLVPGSGKLGFGSCRGKWRSCRWGRMWRMVREWTKKKMNSVRSNVR
jgi:hypothetical protein